MAIQAHMDTTHTDLNIMKAKYRQKNRTAGFGALLAGFIGCKYLGKESIQKLDGGYMNRLILIFTALTLTGCGIAYQPTSVRDDDSANVHIIHLTPETVLEANSSPYTPQSLPDAFLSEEKNESNDIFTVSHKMTVPDMVLTGVPVTPDRTVSATIDTAANTNTNQVVNFKFAMDLIAQYKAQQGKTRIVAVASQTVFNIPRCDINDAFLDVYLNGILLDLVNDYNVVQNGNGTQSTITLITACKAGDIFTAKYDSWGF